MNKFLSRYMLLGLVALSLPLCCMEPVTQPTAKYATAKKVLKVTGIVVGIAVVSGLVIYGCKKWNILPGFNFTKKQVIDLYDESKVFGPCETLSDGSRLCSDIGANYTVTCHASSTGRTIAFDPDGIIGEKVQSNKFNVTAAYESVKTMCDTRSQTYDIANEAILLRSQKYVQILENKAYDYAQGLHLADDGCGQYDITDTGILTKFVKKIKEISINLKLKKTPSAVIVNEQCYPRESNNAAFYGVYNGVIEAYNTLQNNSDQEQCGILGHELMHAKQRDMGYCGDNNCFTGNNFETEADIGALLVSNSPCDAVYFAQSVATALPTITRENMQQMIVGSSKSPHPAHDVRAALIVTMYEYYKRVREQLIAPKYL